MTTPTSSVNNRSRHETIISQTSREASLCRFFTLVSQPSPLVFIETILYIVFNLQSFKEEFEHTKRIIRIRKSKNRQDNDQRKKYKRTNNDLENIHIQLKIE
jgi:hypothetical protein